MAKYTIVTDSCCDLPADLADELGIDVIPLTVTIGGVNYSNFLDGSDISFNQFYSRLGGGDVITTSAVNSETFRTVFESELMLGRDVLYIGFSSALSATANVGAQVAKELAEDYPKRKIIAIDSLCASMGQGLLVYLAAKERDRGATIEQVAKYVEDTKMSVAHWFTVDDLNQLRRGGRISGITAVFGTLLSIKPVLHVSNEGKLESVSKAKGRRAAVKDLFENLCRTAIKPENQVVFISHGDCIDDANDLKEMIQSKFGCEVVISYVGPVIGSHSGKGTLAVFFLGDER